MVKASTQMALIQHFVCKNQCLVTRRDYSKRGSRIYRKYQNKSLVLFMAILFQK